ncbi:MAG: LytTR family DNA-binding domain-containing protein [Ruminococcus flavefaciens]|nr:LytTR family DNA-binding domain-containing protein [Ruminococcus flavefaciens]
MRRIAVIDDEQASRQRLSDHVLCYADERGISLEVIRFESGVQFLEHYSHDFDLVFLDIEMPGMDGMETARELRKMDEDVCIIFVTNLARYALHGYEVNAFDFLVKPVAYAGFTVRFERALRYVGRLREEKTVILQFDGVMKRIGLSEIAYIESAGAYLVYHTSSGLCRVRGALKTAEQELGGDGFLRCNHGYLVNLRYVTDVADDTVTVAGDRLKISRHKKKEFIGGLTGYLGRNV